MSAADIKAGRAFVELFVKDAAFFKSLNAASARLSQLGSAMTSVGVKVFAAGMAVLTPLAAATKSFADAGSAIADMAARTGMGAEGISVLGHAARLTGASIEDVEQAIRKLQQTIAAAAAGSDTAVAALAALGLTAYSLRKLTPEGQLGAVADGLAKIADPALRAAAAMAVMGKSATALIPMLSDGSAGLEAFAKDAERLGLVMSSEDAEAADKLGDALDRLKAASGAAWLAIGKGMAPTVEKLADVLTGASTGLRKWIDANRESLPLIGKLAATATVAGAAIFTLGNAMKAVSLSLGGISAMAKFVATGLALIFSPVTLLVGGLAAATYAAYQFRESLGQLGTIAARVVEPIARLRWRAAAEFGGLAADMRAAWGQIVRTLESGDLQAAGKIAMDNLRRVLLVGALESRLGFLKSMQSLGDQTTSLWGDTLQDLAARTMAGDFSGAWKTLLDGMYAAWMEFVAKVQPKLDELWRGSKQWMGLAGTALQKTFAPNREERWKQINAEVKFRTDSLARKEKSGASYEEVLRAKQAYRRAVNARDAFARESARESASGAEWSGEAGGAWERHVRETRERSRKAREAAKARAEAKESEKEAAKPQPTETEAMRAFRERVKQRAARMSGDISAIEAELRDALTQRFAAEAGQPGAPQLAGGGRAAQGGGDIAAGGTTSSAVGTFSAAALVAMGGGGGVQAKSYEELRSIRKANHEAAEVAKRTARILERIEIIMVGGGATFV